jgi:molybdate transport system substrate-binding protein
LLRGARELLRNRNPDECSFLQLHEKIRSTGLRFQVRPFRKKADTISEYVMQVPDNRALKERNHAGKLDRGEIKMKKFAQKMISLFALLAVFTCLVLPGTVSAADKTLLQVSAAISLKDALNALKGVYSSKEPGVDIQYNFGSSGMLQKQVEEGAPVDLFLSAGKKQMDALAAKGLIVSATRADLLGNEMVLIVAREKKNSIRSFNDLVANAQSFSIGMPETVPAGKYGKETLVSLKLWEKLEKRIVYAKDVRQVLAYVDSGNVDAGLVYRSDTVALKSAVVAAVAPKGSHAPIVYPMAVVKAARHPEAAGKFMEFLKTPEAASVFEKYQFIPLTGKR